MTRARGHLGARTARSAFTLIELMVVISIMAIALSLLVPAFGELLRSINYSNAVNTVSATLGQARALAIRDGRHTAVAFLYDTQREVCSLEVLELQSLTAGSLSPYSATGGTAFVYRPATGQVPVELPKGMAVYGLSFQVAPVDSKIDARTPGWYAGWMEHEKQPEKRRALWLFPMNDARQFLENNAQAKSAKDRRLGVDPWEVLAGRTPSGSSVSVSQAKEAVRAAQTFMIQFAPDGSVVTSPRAGDTFVQNAYIEFPAAPVDRTDPSGSPYDLPDVFDPENDGARAPSPPGAPSQDDLSPNPEVFLRSADQLAVVDMNALGQATGIERPYYARPQETIFPQPQWLDTLGYFDKDAGARDIEDGDEGDDLDPEKNAKHRLISHWIDENGEILSFDRYSGKVIRRESP